MQVFANSGAMLINNNHTSRTVMSSADTNATTTATTTTTMSMSSTSPRLHSSSQPEPLLRKPSTGRRSTSSSSRRKSGELPPLFYYMETGEWEKATDRLRRHPRDVKTWATLRTKSVTEEGSKVSGTKRLALHHACFKLRGAGTVTPAAKADNDLFIQVCRFILMAIRLYPEAAGQRESRHGCLPLHLAAFASCAPRSAAEMDAEHPTKSSSSSNNDSALQKPASISKRASSDATHATTDTHMSALYAEESYAGGMGEYNKRPTTPTSSSSAASARRSPCARNPNVSVSMKSSDVFIDPRREELAVQVINALLDAYPKAARVDSEGGRLPLHTACAGRATPRIVSTLVTAYPSAARHRNKDGFLPLHLAAHWGVSHPNVAITLLKAYPDATVGRNRWERTPLEEALCMAGENGRPHQAAVVRALRKHPSYWTRPVVDLLLHEGSRTGNSTAVDVDESLPSNDDTTLEDQRRYLQYGQKSLLDEDDTCEMGQEVVHNEGVQSSNRKWRVRQKPKPTDTSVPSYLAPGVTLGSLIQGRQWSSMLSRLQVNPLEAEDQMEVMTRGGFLSSTGFSPLHYACERAPPLHVVQALIEAFPVAVLTRTMPGGCLPLHIACTWHASPEIVAALISADVGSVQVKDELGNVALHSACFSGAKGEVVKLLLDADNKTALHRNHQGSRPIDVCKRLRHENRRSVMAMLTTAKQNVVGRGHQRSQSSGNWSDIASQAHELNQRQGPPLLSCTPEQDREGDFDLREHDVALEVKYQEEHEQEGNQELLWI